MTPISNFREHAALQGLSEAEAAARLAQEGPNELPRQGRRNLLRVSLDVLREPMLALLVAGGVIYLLLGDLGESLILLAFACLSVLITVVQETRTEKVLEALRDLTSPRALVIRGGIQRRVAGREVVRGDVIYLLRHSRAAGPKPRRRHCHRAGLLDRDEKLQSSQTHVAKIRSAKRGIIYALHQFSLYQFGHNDSRPMAGRHKPLGCYPSHVLLTLFQFNTKIYAASILLTSVS